MKIYRLTHLKTDGATNDRVNSWHPSAEAVRSAASAARKADRSCNPEYEAVEVPSDKAGLMKFLTERNV